MQRLDSEMVGAYVKNAPVQLDCMSFPCTFSHTCCLSPLPLSNKSKSVKMSKCHKKASWKNGRGKLEKGE